MGKTKLREFAEIQSLTAKMRRHPKQLNTLFSSDSELLKLYGNQFLSISSDGLAEEYEDEIYTDPRTLGWLSVSMSLSDVACSGGLPIGVVLAVNWAKKMTRSFQRKFFEGVNACIKQHDTYLLGGDTGKSARFSVVTTALAHGSGKPLQRTGIRPGDFLACITPFGLHAAYAYDFLLRTQVVGQTILQPKIPFQRIQQMKPYLSGAIDNSDGLMSTMAILSDLNHVSFEMNLSALNFHSKAQQFCRQKKISPMALAWAELGGYELIVAVKKRYRNSFLAQFPEIAVFAEVVPYQQRKQKIFTEHAVGRSYFKKMQQAIKRCSQPARFLFE